MKETEPKHVISAAISGETYHFGKESGIKWSRLIEMGLLANELRIKHLELKSQYEELERRQRRTAELLGKYASGDTNVLG